MMNNRDHIAAANALADWFVSQSIEPADGVIVMMLAIAHQMVATTRDPRALYKGLEIHTELLVTSVHEALHVP